MHDLDRALQELEYETPGSYQVAQQGEADGEYEADAEYEADGEYEADAEYEADGEYEADAEYGGEGEYGDSEYEYEAESEADGEFEGDEFEDEQSDEYQLAAMPPAHESEAVLDEMEQMEQAAALLEVQGEDELEQFLGSLIGKVAKKLKSFVPEDLRKSLSGALGKVAKAALPKLGAAFGNLVVPGAGGAIGAAIGANASKLFGLELEGMSHEDQEFEVAKRVVSLGVEATRAAAESAAAGGATTDTAKDAVVQAAQTQAPGLAAAIGPGYAPAGYPRRRRPGPRRRSGRWFRRGRRIVLVGL